MPNVEFRRPQTLVATGADMYRVAWNEGLDAPCYSICGLYDYADVTAATLPFEARESPTGMQRSLPKPGSLTERGVALAESGFGYGVPAALLCAWAWLTAHPVAATESPAANPKRLPVPKPRGRERRDKC